MPNLENDFRKLTTDARQMAEQNARLRKVNSQMIYALEYVLPLLQQGLPATVDFDWTKPLRRSKTPSPKQSATDPNSLARAVSVGSGTPAPSQAELWDSGSVARSERRKAMPMLKGRWSSANSN
jgi:hypothetical protein